MGHTLVTRFDAAGYGCIQALLNEAGIRENNKIPFGRDCDRRAANDVLPCHVTVCHWPKAEDARLLPAIQSFRFRPCRINVISADAMTAEEGSLLLYLNVAPGEGFEAMCRSLAAVTGLATSGFWHMTLSVSLDHDLIRRQHRALTKVLSPFGLDVTGLDLYHIWRPTRYVKTLGPSGEFTA